jgi:hypothetical protein
MFGMLNYVCAPTINGDPERGKKGRCCSENISHTDFLVALRLEHQLGDFSPLSFISRKRGGGRGKERKHCIDISSTVCNQHTNKRKDVAKRKKEAEERKKIL